MTSPTDNPHPTDIAQDKAALRRAVRKARKQRPASDKAKLDQGVCDGAAAVVRAFSAAHSRPPKVAAYMPLPAEPGGEGFVPVLADAAAELWLPITGPRGTELTWARYTGPESLQPGPLGISEPAGQAVGADELHQLDIVFVPALALSTTGVRLGQGGGYYDRTLTALPGPQLIGVVFDDEVYDRVPAATHDAVLDAILTPSGCRDVRATDA